MGLKIHELKQMPIFWAEDPCFLLSGIKMFETIRKKFG